MTQYPILFENITTSLPNWLKKQFYTHIAVIVDEHTKVACYPIVKKYIPPHYLIEIHSGEENKNLQTCVFLWQELTEKLFDRKSLIINLGGGVIGDMGGFVASTFKRGIDFIQIPTTLLSQVDASVGGKLGIDFHGFKNHIGVFKDPEAVFIDTQFLETLSEKEILSGYAEVIKHAIIADKVFWQELIKKDFKKLNWKTIVPRAVKIKEDVVVKDPLEKGLRKILNFGHTVGHAFESYYLHHPEYKLLHGEAIAIGMLLETFLSWRLGLISEEALQAVEHFLLPLYPQVPLSEASFEALVQLMMQDKKNEDEIIKMALLDDIGKALYNISVSEGLIYEALQHYLLLTESA